MVLIYRQSFFFHPPLLLVRSSVFFFKCFSICNIPRYLSNVKNFTTSIKTQDTCVLGIYFKTIANIIL